DSDLALEASVHGIMLQHVSQIIRLQQIIDRHHLNIREILERSTESHAADTPEPVDTHSDCHLNFLSSQTKREPIDRLPFRHTTSNYNTDLTVFTTFSTVKPKCFISTPPGADSPKVSIPTTAPSRPTY